MHHEKLLTLVAQRVPFVRNTVTEMRMIAHVAVLVRAITNAQRSDGLVFEPNGVVLAIGCNRIGDLRRGLLLLGIAAPDGRQAEYK